MRPPRLDIAGRGAARSSASPTKLNGVSSNSLIAIQSSWLPKPKIVCACRMPALGGLLRAATDIVVPVRSVPP